MPPSSALAKLIAAEALFAPYEGKTLEDGGVTVEGVALGGQRLFAGFRGPVIENKRAVILSAALGHFFDVSGGSDAASAAARAWARRARPCGLRQGPTAHCGCLATPSRPSTRSCKRSGPPKPSGSGARNSRSRPSRSRSGPRSGACLTGLSTSWPCRMFSASFPVTIDGKQIGEIMFSPDISADLYEKWIGFLALLSSGIALMLLTGSIAYFITGAAVGPLQKLGEGLTHLRSGDYERLISGIRSAGNSAQFGGGQPTCQNARPVSQDNRSLLRRIVSLQDDERQDIARELHDELGPLLFGIRANTVALMESLPPDMTAPEASAQGILHSVEALSTPTAASSTGCGRSISRNWVLNGVSTRCCRMPGRRRRSCKLTTRIDPGLNEIDGPLSQTVYRVIQEAVTNVLSHANARSLEVTATRQ